MGILRPKVRVQPEKKLLVIFKISFKAYFYHVKFHSKHQTLVMTSRKFFKDLKNVRDELE
jgi:hypothetical protein